MRRTVLCLTIGMILSAPTPAAEGARSRSSMMEGAQAAANELGVYCCPSPAFVTGELLVTFEPNTSLTTVENIARRLGCTVIRRITNTPTYLIGVPRGQEMALIPLFSQFSAVIGVEVNQIGCLDDTLPCCCCPGTLTCSNLSASCPSLPILPRGSAFWGHQCSDQGFQALSTEELFEAFSTAYKSSIAYRACNAPVGCAPLLEDLNSDMRSKTEKELQALWLNATTCRLSTESSIDLPEMTSAGTVGGALYQIEQTLCNPHSSRAALEQAKDLAEALNQTGEDVDLVVPSIVLPAISGETTSFTIAVVNLSDAARSYALSAEGTWPVRISMESVELAADTGIPILVEMDVPSWVQQEQRLVINVRAISTTGDPIIQREVSVPLKVVSRDARPDSPLVIEGQ